MSYGVELSQEDIVAELLGADRDIARKAGESRRWKVVLVGAGSLAVMGYITRSTGDIDAWQGPMEFREEFERHNINFRAKTHETGFPENIEDRVVPLDLDTRVIDYYRVSLEDAVALKLSAGREHDLQDVRSPAVLRELDWELMAAVAQEMRFGTISEQESWYRNFLWNYKNYREESGPRA